MLDLAAADPSWHEAAALVRHAQAEAQRQDAKAEAQRQDAEAEAS